MTNPSNQDLRQTRHLDMLEELASLAMALTRAAAEKAQAHIEDPEPGPDPIIAFTRLASTVRQLIALEARIANPNTKAPGMRPGPRPVDEALEFIAEATRACAKADPAATRRHGPTKRHIERNIDERIEAEDITALIEEDMPACVIVSTICDDLIIQCDVNEQPDENLIPLSEALELRRIARIPINYSEDYEEEEDPLPSPSPSGLGPRSGPRSG